MKIYVVNGYPGSGKTTFERMACKKLGDGRGFIYSTIHPIKELAQKISWDGTKDAAGRRLLSDLKQAMNRYCNYTMETLEETINAIEMGCKEALIQNPVVFIDSREPDEIAAIKKLYNATTILIVRDKPKELSNKSDSNVNKYHYDYAIINKAGLKEFDEAVDLFLQMEDLIEEV